MSYRSTGVFLPVFICALFFSFVVSAKNTPDHHMINVYEKDHRIHLVMKDGQELLAPKIDEKDEDEVGTSAPKLAPNGQVAGWLVEYTVCCLSYPLPTTLVLYQNGALSHKIAPLTGMIKNWMFVKGGKEVALASIFPHGEIRGTAKLYDVATGQERASTPIPFDLKTPLWAKGLDSSGELSEDRSETIIKDSDDGKSSGEHGKQ